MKAFASTAGAVGIGVAAWDCSRARADANTARRTKLSRGRNMNGNTLVKNAGACRSDRRLVYRLIQREMCIVHAGALQRRHDAIEFRDVGNGTDAHSVHFAACDEVIADENLAVSAAA